MIDTNNNQASATIDQSINVPDYFSCQNCIAWKNPQMVVPGHRTANQNGWATTCEVLRDSGTCAKMLLGEALQKAQIILHLSKPV